MGDKEYSFLCCYPNENRIYELCKDSVYKFNNDFLVKDRKSNFYRNHHFMDITKSKYLFPTHYGGEIYYRNSKDTIVIAFRVKGDAILVNDACDSLKKHLNKGKVYENPVQYPLLWLFSIKKTKALSKKEMQEQQLTKPTIKEFDVFLPWESEFLEER